MFISIEDKKERVKPVARINKNSSPVQSLESAFWDVLKIDEVGHDMASEKHAPNSTGPMNTGHTNQCFICNSSSATTSGCRTCC